MKVLRALTLSGRSSGWPWSDGLPDSAAMGPWSESLPCYRALGSGLPPGSAAQRSAPAGRGNGTPDVATETNTFSQWWCDGKSLLLASERWLQGRASGQEWDTAPTAQTMNREERV